MYKIELKQFYAFDLMHEIALLEKAKRTIAGIPYISEEENKKGEVKMNKKMAIELIEDFLILEYDYTIDTARKSIYEDISCIGLAHTENDEGVPVQISINLEDYEIIVDVFGKDKQIKKYDSIDSLIENELMYLNFDELVGEFL